MSETSMTGRLLVATPRLVDAMFRRAVIVVLDHDEAGALGVIVNRPSSVEVSAVLPTWQPLTTQPGVLFQGGPVARDSALGLASVLGEDEPLGWRRVAGSLGLVDLDAPPEVLAAEMAALRIFAGYAGWAAGQLEAEIGEESWYVVDAEPADPFSDEPDQLWRTVLRRQSGELAFVSTYPDDPALN